ncbi:MAG TPA: hypothetical protein VKI17_08630, partial [Gemmataceae bacterium]|nr:hypothetical protein [Gemmataceae bacterium]
KRLQGNPRRRRGAARDNSINDLRRAVGKLAFVAGAALLGPLVMLGLFLGIGLCRIAEDILLLIEETSA